MPLTTQQQAIVNHNTGPALVFAVAGSGKTTSMIRRIERLVREGHHPANKILATSFGKATVDDIKKALNEVNISGVQALTLHGLGFRIIRKASRRGYFPEQFLKIQDNIEFLNEILVRRAVGKLCRQQNTSREKLQLDEEDLVNQISAWKGNLIYHNLDEINLPAKAIKMASQASHPNPHYLKIYQIYEKERINEQWLTFDDMLLTAWELLVQYDDILHDFQAQFETVMVDEFQDVNKVQYLLVDLLVEPHRNYMAIGDDDQCIYEWRGAQPEFILSFAEEYGAALYEINDNFRSTGQQVLLANEIIHHNKKRFPKKLSLTKGFKGNTFILREQDSNSEAEAISLEIKEKIEQGENIENLAILIRLYAQTPAIEAALIQHEIKYQIVGSIPFYRRPEISCLLKYLRFALTEKEILAGNGYPTIAERKRYIKDFKTILWNPKKYISRQFTDLICRQSMQHQSSVLEELINASHQLHNRVQDRVDTFLQVLEELMERIDQPASNVLDWLVSQLGYKQHLIQTSGVTELGEFKWEAVLSFIEFTKVYGNCESLLSAIYRLAQGYKNLEVEPDESWLKIMTVYRAKGLEWNTVFIPGCNQGIFPYLKEGENNQSNLEAERRLFYVGLTRAKQNLYLSHENTKPVSQFLLEANSQKVVEDSYKLGEILKFPSQEIIEKGLLRKLELIACQYPLGKYFREWFPGGIQLNLPFSESA